MAAGNLRASREILLLLAITFALLAIYFVATKGPEVPIYDVVPTCEGMRCRQDADCGSRCDCISEDDEGGFGRCRQKQVGR